MGSDVRYLEYDEQGERDRKESILLYPLSAPMLFLRNCMYLPSTTAGGLGNQGNAR